MRIVIVVFALVVFLVLIALFLTVRRRLFAAGQLLGKRCGRTVTAAAAARGNEC